MHSIESLSEALSAAGEPTRLRLMALCTAREWSVSELAAAVEQSEARVSRHLKILAAARLLRRHRRGQWVYYGIEGPLAAAIVGQLDPADRVRQRDDDRARRRLRDAGDAMPAATRAGRAIAAFIAEGPPGVPVGRMLLIEPRELELLVAATRIARHTVVVARIPRVREALREYAERQGLTLTLRAAAPPPVQGGEAFDAALLDLTAERGAEGLASPLAALRARLGPTARLWIVSPYDAFEVARGNVLSHPIALLRGALADAGFVVERVKPVESGAGPLLVAQATRSAAAEHAA